MAERSSQSTFVPEILCGQDGEPPTYVSTAVAKTGAEAIAYALKSGEIDEAYPVSRVLMRELDPIACRARGYEEGWWVECTDRAKHACSFWRIDE